MQEQEPHKKHVISITTKTCVKVGITLFLVILAATWFRPFLGLIGSAVRAATPLLIGFAVAYVVNILMTLYERHYFTKREDQKWVQRSRRPVCLILALATVIGAIALILCIVLPQLRNALGVLKDKIPNIMEEISRNKTIMRFLPQTIQDALRELDVEKLVGGVFSFLSNGATSGDGVLNLTGFIGSFTSAFMTGFMGFVFSIYILLGKERLSKQFGRFFRTYLRAGWIDKLKPVVSVANNSFHFFIVGQVTEGIIIGLLCALGMWILRLPYAAMIGTVIGVTALIPILGCYLGAGIGALMCLSVGLGTAIEFLIFIFCLQQFEDNLIYPRVVGTSIGLPAIWVLASVTVGGGIGGFAGMILAVPVFATIYQLVRMDVGRREKKAGKPALADDAARQEALDECKSH